MYQALTTLPVVAVVQELEPQESLDMVEEAQDKMATEQCHQVQQPIQAVAQVELTKLIQVLVVQVLLLFVTQ
jgi:hypothetical protein